METSRQYQQTMTAKSKTVDFPQEGSGDDSLLSKSAQGAKLLIILQVASRALTFTVNQFLLRYLSPSLLGISTQLEVYSISILFFAREALRVAIQRQTDEPDTSDSGPVTSDADSKKRKKSVAAIKTQTVVNLAYISIALGILITFLLQWLYIRSAQVFLLTTPYFNEALYLYSASAMLELFSEPSFVVVQQKSKYSIRATAEMVATLLRCFATCGVVVVASKSGHDYGVLPFALGQFTYAASLLLVYVGNTWFLATQFGFSLVPKAIAASPPFILSYFAPSLLSLAASLFFQGLLKHVLTQGDVFLITYLSTLSDQGIYALASNYGGLIARLLFQPIEESSRNYFAKALSAPETQAEAAPDPKKSSTSDTAPSKFQVETASSHLHQLLRFYMILSVSAASIGPSVAPLLLNIVAGRQWSSTNAGQVLGKYCYYIPLLALNGITESFISATATKAQLNAQSVWMIFFSLAFASSGYVFLKVLDMGAEGLVWANVFNMTCRIIWSTAFIRSYLGRLGVALDFGRIWPGIGTVGVGVAAAAVLNRLSATFTSGIWDFIKVAPVIGGYLIALAISERRDLIRIYHAVTTRK